MAKLDFHLTVALRSFVLDVALGIGGETLALVGPSGAGKTTVLRALAGLGAPDHGHVIVDDHVWFDAADKIALAPERRSVGVVFQDYALFPHMTVTENVAFARGTEPAVLLERFGVAHLAHARPGQLSGGERQRVALARALARSPKLLLLDEPLSALDTHTRAGVRDELGLLLGELSMTTLLITHDFRDAAVLADRVAVIVDGRIRQLGTAAQLLASPADAFVASFTGATVLAGHATPRAGGGSLVQLDAGGTLLTDTTIAGPVHAAVAPWNVRLADTPGPGRLTAPLDRAAPDGAHLRVRVGPLVAHTTAAELAALGAQVGDLLHAHVEPRHVRVFPAPSGTRVPPAHVDPDSSIANQEPPP